VDDFKSFKNDLNANFTLRQPAKAKNDKNMNKRKPAKAKPAPLQLQPAVSKELFDSKKAVPPKKAYQSK